MEIFLVFLTLENAVFQILEMLKILSRITVKRTFSSFPIDNDKVIKRRPNTTVVESNTISDLKEPYHRG